MLLQIMEEGRLTDSYGRQVDFKNTIIIMTSNIGAQRIGKEESLGFRKSGDDVSREKMREMLKEELERHFRPEFLNRVDDIAYFLGLTRDDLKDIIDIELAHVHERLAGKGFKARLTDAAKEIVIDMGYHPEFGARPLRRAIERLIEDRLSEDLLAGKFAPGATIVVDTNEEGALTFDVEKPEAETPEPEPAST
jgi:ATP-dependent Clp protease ATP-binding subunit ClpC